MKLLETNNGNARNLSGETESRSYVPRSRAPLTNSNGHVRTFARLGAQLFELVGPQGRRLDRTGPARRGPSRRVVGTERCGGGGKERPDGGARAEGVGQYFPGRPSRRLTS